MLEAADFGAAGIAWDPAPFRRVPTGPGDVLILVSIARRYARALFEAAGDGYESAGQELAALAQGIDGSKDVAALFANPSTPRELKNRMVEAAIAQAGVSVLVGNTLRLLNDRDRIPYISAIVRAFGALADERTGRLRARITSATELPGQMAEQPGGRWPRPPTARWR